MIALRRGWVEVVCPVHGFICEAPASSSVYCRACDRWIYAPEKSR